MSALVLKFKEREVHHHNEMLSLTDMWRAAGSDPSKRPYEWGRKEGAPFVEFIAESSNTPIERIWIAERGHDGATWAHWQIGFAYAKYLSPEVHAWFNTIVRAHMEGRRSTPIAEQITELLLPLERIERTVTDTHGEVVAIRHDVSNIAINRYKFSNESQIEWKLVVIAFFDCRCPCCEDMVIVENSEWNDCYEPDHWFARNKNKVSDGWPACVECNRRLASDTDYKDSKATKFKEFHSARDRYKKQQARAKAEIADQSRSNERAMTSDEYKKLKQSKLF